MPKVDTRNMSWEYIAGFLDGEGSIMTNTSYGKNGRGKGVRVVLVNTYKPVLEVIDTFLKKEGIVGTINLKPNNYGKRWDDGCHRKPCWQWRIGRKIEVALLLSSLLPYLIIKYDKALEAIAFANRPDPRINTYQTLERRQKTSQVMQLWWNRRKQVAEV